LAVHSFQRFDTIPFSGRYAITSTDVSLRTPNPGTKRIRPTTDLGCNRSDRSRLTVKFALMVEHHPHGTFTHFSFSLIALQSTASQWDGYLFPQLFFSTTQHPFFRVSGKQGMV